MVQENTVSLVQLPGQFDFRTVRPSPRGVWTVDQWLPSILFGMFLKKWETDTDWKAMRLREGLHPTRRGRRRRVPKKVCQAITNGNHLSLYK